MAAFLKFVMFTFNFIFWVIGGTMLGIGIWLAVDDDAYEVLDIASSAGMDDGVWAAAVYTSIAVGAFLFLVGFLGCWGSLGSGRRAALMAYSFIVILILITEIVVVILIAVFYSRITDSLQSGMQKDVRTKYNETGEETLTKLWDNMQQEFKCCGGAGYADYGTSAYFNRTDNIVPKSCCSDKSVLAYERCKNEAKGRTVVSPVLYKKGCYNGLEDYLEGNAGILIGITCGFAALQVVGVLIACCIMKRDKRDSI